MNATNANVMMPMDFCASFDPCEKAMPQAETSCRRRDATRTVPGRKFLAIQVSPTITKKATMKPSVGDKTNGTSTFCVSACHLKADRPACATTAPPSPPISAWDELDGMPHHQVSKFQTQAPSKAAKTTVWVTITGFAKPEAIVLATAVPAMAPTKLKQPATITAVRKGKTPVDTTVAIALAAS